jgi:lysophospholipase L1-like esterase
MTKQRSAIKGDRALWQSVFGVQLILGLILGNLYLLSHNTLHNNGRWRSTKYEAAMHLMASEAYYLRPQALASNRLNLSAWHGFNEVMYHEPVELQSIKADVDLGPNAYVSVIFNATETGYAGVRLSNNPHYSSMLFTCAPDGTFVKKQGLAVPRIPAGQHVVQIELTSENVVIIALSGAALGKFHLDVEQPQRVGFRGGLRTVTVDDVLIRRTDGDAIYEGFSPRGNIIKTTAGAIALVLLVNLPIALWIRRRRGSRRRALFHVLMWNVLAVVSSVGFYAVQYSTGHYYPDVTAEMQRTEEQFRNMQGTVIMQAIKENYDEIAIEGVVRILALGTSQTWGCGASAPDRTMMHLLENQLNTAVPCRYEIINAAVSGTGSGYMYQSYLQLVRYHPDIVLVNLANNDPADDWFTVYLEKIVDLGATHGSTVVLVAEPNCLEHGERGLFAKYERMRLVAAERNVHFIDLHARMRQRYEEGFLWWDFVHPTDCGHRIAAEALFDGLQPILPPCQ